MIDESIDYCGDDCQNYWRERAETAEAQLEFVRGNVDILRERAERAEAEMAGLRLELSGCRQVAGEAEAERDHLLMDKRDMDEYDTRWFALQDRVDEQALALARVRALCDGHPHMDTWPKSVSVDAIRAALDGDS